MEAATKNKRGRPKGWARTAGEIVLPEKGQRAAANTLYAMLAIDELAEGRQDGFFVTSRGTIRRQGIAEQIGRMYHSGIITADQGRELIRECKEDYKQGRTVKEIEQTLRLLNGSLK